MAESILFEVVDRRGYKIQCTQRQWDCHVISGHPEMKGQEELVKQALIDPFAIYADINKIDREIYYYFPSEKYRYIRVVVRINHSKRTGALLTAFPSSTGKNRERMIWPRSEV